MDMNFYYLPKAMISFLAFIGLCSSVYFLNYIFTHLKYRYIYKKPYMSPDQLKYFILLEEIKILKTKIQQLEEENEEMTSSLIKHLQG